MSSTFMTEYTKLVAHALKKAKQLYNSKLYDQWITYDKNEETLTSLGYTIDLMWNVILGLVPQDYIQGPEPDDREPPRFKEVWMFAVTIPDSGGKEIYIKLGFTEDNRVVCISFHFAEFKVHWPLKNKNVV